MKRLHRKIKALALVFLVFAGTIQAPVQAISARAEEPVKISYQAFNYPTAWSDKQADDTPYTAPEGTYMTGFQAVLINQPQNVTGGLEYQVEVSGSSWTEWTAGAVMAGHTEGEAPAAALRMRLTGGLKDLYDVCYSIQQNGTWSPWVRNDEGTAGQEGSGLKITGMRMTVITKGAAIPGEKAEKTGIDPNRPMVALTFDDGPHGPVTNRILDSLEANGGRATFFMVGNRVKGKANTAAVARMTALGCEVANHTYEHKAITKLSAAGIQSQLEQTNDHIRMAGGVSPVLMRPPGGAKNDVSMKTVGSMGMSAVLWSIDTLDWKTKNKQKTIDAVIGHVKDGDIILMHDIYGPTADAAEVIIPKLKAMGFQLVTVSEMASYRGGIQPGKVYSRFRP